MRTTVNLPPAVHQRAAALAQQQHRSLSAVICDMTIRGLAQVDSPVTLHIDEISGLPVLSLGRTVSTEEVATLLDQP